MVQLNLINNLVVCQVDPGKTIKRLLIARTNLILIGEFHSSRKCCICHTDLVGKGYCKRSMVLPERLPWGVKRCWKCRITFNRDINACFNLGYISWFQLYNDGKRPTGFYKEKSSLLNSQVSSTAQVTTPSSTPLVNL